MSRSNSKKHQRHKQPPGICSICLNEKLSQLISTPIINNSSSSSSQATKSLSSSSSSDLSSLSSSSNPSLCSSPASNIGYSRKMDLSKGRKSIRVSRMLWDDKVVCLTRLDRWLSLPRRDESTRMKMGRRLELVLKEGFGQTYCCQEQGLMHSKTMRERVTHQFIN